MSRVKVTVIGSGKNVDRFIKENERSEYIKVIGVIPDAAFEREDLTSYVALLQETDIGFALGYSRIIPTEICDNYLIVNLHAGILPKWRGFSANAWAVMNGEEEIGYSLHQVTSELDGGPLFFVKHIPLKESDTMGDVHGIMMASIIKDCPRVLKKIVSGEKKGIRQDDSEIVYCTRFNRTMGEIKDFGKDAQYYVNLYRCMAEPLGSGVYFIYRNKEYRIGKIEHGKKYGSADYLCTEGKIVCVSSDNIWVKTKDNVVVLSEIREKGVLIDLKKCFINGQRLGEKGNV